MEFEEWLFDDIHLISNRELNSNNQIMIYPGHVKFLNIAKTKGFNPIPIYKYFFSLFFFVGILSLFQIIK